MCISLMKPSSSSQDNLQLSSREYTIIRAYLLGFSDTSLLQLLDCSKQELVNSWHELYQKFRVENKYSVIKKALQIGLVSEDNYQPEFVKEATLAYLDEFGTQQAYSSTHNINNNKWESYQYLLKYLTFLNQYENQKKTHRSGIKDF